MTAGIRAEILSLAQCAFLPDEDLEKAAQERPSLIDQMEMVRRLEALTRRVEYIEKWLQIAERRTGDETYGVET